MRQIVENQVRANFDFLSYAYQFSEYDQIETALREGSVRFLLEQSEFNESEIAEKIKKTREAIAAVINALPNTAGELKKHLTTLGKEIPQAAEVAGAIIEDDKKKLQDLAKRVATSTDAATEFAATAQAAFVKVGEQFSRFAEALDESEKTRSLEELSQNASKKPDIWKGKFVTYEQLSTGLKKSFVTPGWYGRALKKGKATLAAAGSKKGFGKISKWLLGLFGDDANKPDPKIFVTTALSMSFDDFMATSEKMKTLIQQTEIAVQSAAEVSTSTMAAASGTTLPKNDGSDSSTVTDEDATLSPEEIKVTEDEATQLSQAMGKMPVSKEKLAVLLKKPEFADIAGKGSKAMKARRKLRLAINDIVGKTVFEEGLLTGSRRIKPVKNDTNDDETFNRWKDLAGIK